MGPGPKIAAALLFHREKFARELGRDGLSEVGHQKQIDCRASISMLMWQVGARAEDINIGKHLTGKPKTVTVIDPMIPEKCEVTEIGQSPDSIYRQIPSGLEDFHESGFDCLLALGLDCW